MKMMHTTRIQRSAAWMVERSKIHTKMRNVITDVKISSAYENTEKVSKKEPLLFSSYQQKDYVVIRKKRLASPDTQAGYTVSKHLNFIFKASYDLDPDKINSASPRMISDWRCLRDNRKRENLFIT